MIFFLSNFFVKLYTNIVIVSSLKWIKNWFKDFLFFAWKKLSEIGVGVFVGDQVGALSDDQKEEKWLHCRRPGRRYRSPTTIFIMHANSLCFNELQLLCIKWALLVLIRSRIYYCTNLWMIIPSKNGSVRQSMTPYSLTISS